MSVQIPRPKRGSEGQWALGYREPLNAAEQTKKDEDGLKVRERIYEYAAAERRGELDAGRNIFAADLRQRMKWYGIYTQRPEEDGYFMVRTRIPGGALTSEQLRAIAGISRDFGRDVADVTDRQNVQFHWVRIADVPELWERLEDVGLTTAEACGDVPRNILGCALSGIDADEVLDASPYVYAVNERLVNDPSFSNLPRKYKMSIAGCRHQCAVHEVNDVGLVAHELDDGTKGFDVWVGGGLSSTPHMAQRLGVFVRPEEVVDVCVGITEVFRDYGYRRSRNKARLKFLVADWGPELFRRVLEEEYLGRPLDDGPEAKPSNDAHRDHAGVWKQHDGRNYVGFALRSGRTSGSDLFAIADLADELGAGRVRLTTQQKMVVCDVPDERLAPAMDRLESLGYPVFSSPFRTGAMACTGVEFCKLALVETKGRMNALADELTRRLPDFDEPLRINVNGCPNSCARYQLADIGFMGVLVTEKTKEDGTTERLEGFNVHLGGHLGAERAFGRKQRGIRLRADELVSFSENLIRIYQDRRNGHGSFGEWLNTHDDKTLNALAREAATGLARVGPIPLAVEGVRQDH